MIVTLTMNPAVDKTVYIDWLRTGQLNRISRKALDAGGKGINAARMLRVLGCECIAAGIAGGSAGRFIEDTLENEGIRTDFLHIEEETRTNEKIIEENGTMTELNEPGPLLTPEILGRCQEKLSAYAGPDTVFVISGSIPQGVSPDYYAHLIRLLKRKGSRVILDADGELLRLGIEAQPDAVKPNLQELSSYFGLGAQRHSSCRHLPRGAGRAVCQRPAADPLSRSYSQGALSGRRRRRDGGVSCVLSGARRFL